jgi:hypothetical protein
MMTQSQPGVTVHVNLDISAQALQTVVAVAKKLAGRDARGHYRVDTADLLSQMISRFLVEKDFAGYVQDTANYPL